MSNRRRSASADSSSDKTYSTSMTTEDRTMRWYRNLKTMTKLMLGFALMGALLAGLGWFSIDNIARVNANVEIIYQRQMLPIISLQTIAEYRQQIRGDLYRAITTKDDAEMKELINGIHSRQQEIVESEKKFEATIVVEEVREAFKKYLALTKDFVKY